VTDAGPDARGAIDAVWRIESPRLIAGLARMVRDVGLAEDLAQDALVAALEQWPESGVPDNPGAWLMATAKRRGIDRLRRDRIAARKSEELGRELEVRGEAVERDLAAAIDDPFDDDLLRLIFTTCHPLLSTEARVALTLRLLGGLTTPEIARAYLISESTVAQRIVRAKRTLAAARVPIEVPVRDQLPERLAAVLEVVYLIFNEGYSPSSGDAVVRIELLEEAMRLGRILAELLPTEPEVHGLVALIGCRHRGPGRVSIPPASPCRCSSRIAPAGIGCSSAAASGRSSALTPPAARSARTHCRRQSPHVIRRHGTPQTPTGCGSQRSTTASPRSPRPRSSD
jgi:RNA polymerase sigma factor (sigma-70 family)